MRTRSLASTKGVMTCPQPRCGGIGGIEDTLKQDTWYVKRVRGCNKCGAIWSTAEVPLPMIKRLMKVETFLRGMQA